jgi:hypothetical protein
MTSQKHREDPVQQIVPGYSDEPRPLGGYVAVMGLFNAVFVGFMLLLRKRRYKLPERIGVTDLALLGVAAFKVSRLLAKDAVTSPVRAPFTQFEGPSGPPAEISESVRVSGVRHAIGELLICPFCLGLWVAALFSYGLVLAPRATRLIASIFTIDAISDSLNLIYDAGANVVTRTPQMLDEHLEEEG